MPDFLSLDDRELARQCDVDVYRASGPGGQKRNKVSSAVRLRHRETGLIVTATESRSQHDNRARALRRLRQAIALNARRAVDPESYEPTELLASCISGSGKLVVGRRDHRYHRAVREILDVLVASEMQVAAASSSIGVSTANLVGFFKNDPDLWKRVNELRAQAGYKLLR